MSANVATVIGAHTRVQGDVSAYGDVVVEGRVEGNVRAAGQLTLGPNASVTGTIEARDIRVGGKLDRGVRADGVVHLLSTAEVRGDLEAGRVIIDDGAIFEGQVRLARAARHSARRPSAAERVEPAPSIARAVADTRAAVRSIPELAVAGRRRAQRRPS